MSEPQHPQPHDTDMHTGRHASAAGPAAVQPAVQTGFDSLASVGARLAQLRGSKGLSVEDVSARLKVSPVKLRALEAGDLSQLPDTTFALGVVRSYAKMVGADPAPMTQALRREKGVPEPDLTMPASSGTGLPRGKVSLSLGGAPRHRSWLWGIALAIVVLIALAMWHTNNGGDSSAWLARLKATAGGATSTEPASSAAAPASGAAVTGEVAAPGSDAQAAAADGASATPMPAPLPTAGVTTPASGFNAASAAVAPKAASAAPAAVAAASAAAASAPADVPEGEATVALKVTQDSWFSVRQKNGKEIFSGLVHAGETKEISGETPFKVTVGNTAGLESMTLDGEPVDPSKYASAKGNVARFALP
jgi:cytoskeleton protein RodZ